MMAMKPEQVSEWIGRIVDVRDPDEFAAERLPAAQCVPLPTLLASAAMWDKTEPVLLVCKSGVRARRAAEQLSAAGFAHVALVEGGLDACKRAGVGVIVNHKTIPLFRQVLTGAGLLLLVGLGLSLVHSAFVLLAWFVAGGLTIAGLTGFCPMARLLEKMPWNSGSACAGGSCSANNH